MLVPRRGQVGRGGGADGGDLGVFFVYWGDCQVEDCPADFNDDEIVDGIDATASMAALSLETKNSTRRAFSNGRANAKKMVSDMPIPAENDLQDKKRQN